LIVLPKQASAGLSASFSATDLNNWLSALHSTDLSLALPKFMLETSMSIIDTLKSLGITDAFDDSAANFSGIDGRRDLKISKAVHKAVVEVDETGTKAAAVTGIAVGLIHACACSPPPPIPFTADHPFHFLILDHQTDSILFVGQVQQPTAYDGNDQPAVELPKTQFTPVQPPGGIPIQPPGIMPIESPRVSPIGPPRITFFPPPQLISPVTSNPANPFDVNGDGEESPADALIVINYINDHSQQSSLSQLTTQLIGSHLYADVDGDGIVTPRDALRIINRLNEKPASAAPTAIIPDSALGEGESAASDTNPFASAVDALLSLDDVLRIDNLLRPDQLATPRRALQTS